MAAKPVENDTGKCRKCGQADGLTGFTVTYGWQLNHERKWASGPLTRTTRWSTVERVAKATCSICNACVEACLRRWRFRVVAAGVSFLLAVLLTVESYFGFVGLKPWLVEHSLISALAIGSVLCLSPLIFIFSWYSAFASRLDTGSDVAWRAMRRGLRVEQGEWAANRYKEISAANQRQMKLEGVSIGTSMSLSRLSDTSE